MLWSLLVVLQCLARVGQARPAADEDNGPRVHVLNGTYYGLRNEHYWQDQFMGIPYAKPPMGERRYRPPESLDSSWSGEVNATQHGYACMGYGEDTVYAAGNYTSEDCLTMNIVRPFRDNVDDSELWPVAVWIHGGGYVAGSAFNKPYNTSFIVQQSALIGRPIIVVSIQYRLSAWGYLWSSQMVDQGIANLGLRDQHLALRWIQENIQRFGGDPNRVTIWGESSGSASVGDLLLAYNGRDDGLFSAAVAESGAPTGFGMFDVTPDLAEMVFANITSGTDCAHASDQVACLRQAPVDVLNNAINASLSVGSGSGRLEGVAPLIVHAPLPDGDIVAEYPIVQMSQARFVKVPFLHGDSTDEGSGLIPWGFDTDSDLEAFFVLMGLSHGEASEILEAYPFTGLPDADEATIAQIGRQFSRLTTIATDMLMKAPRRLAFRYWLQHCSDDEAPLYSYNWNATYAGIPAYYGAMHWDELAYVFHNTDGYGFYNHSLPWYGPNPFMNRSQEYFDLADTASRMWISFFNDHNPNYPEQLVPHWPPYTRSDPVVMDFNAPTASHLMLDDYRQSGMDLIMKLMIKHKRQNQ